MTISQAPIPKQRAQKGGVDTSGSNLRVISAKKICRAEPPQRAGVILEAVIGCKWSLTIYHLMRLGINRPGAMERSVTGLSAKVLNDCLRRNVDLGILEKRSFPEIPPRVEYHFTPFGLRFEKVIEAVQELQRDLDCPAEK